MLINTDHPRYAAALAFLHQVAADTGATGTGGAAAITGPTGAGVSAILAHAERALPMAVGTGLPGHAALVPFGAAARLHAAVTRTRAAADGAGYFVARVPKYRSLLTELHQVLIAGINTGVYPIDDLAPYVDAAARAIADGLIDAAQQHRISVLAADQIGWWDPSSRSVLAHLAAAAPGAGLLVVAADATDEPRAGTWIDHTLNVAAAPRHRIPGLDADEIATLAIDMGFTLAPGAAEAIAAATGGHPVTVALHLRRLAADPRTEVAPPAAVGDAAKQTLAALPKADRRLLAAAAACGPRFDTATLADITRRTPAAVHKQLAQIAATTDLVAGGHRVPGPRETLGYVWRHAACRDAVLDDIEASTRRGLHASASRSLKTAHHGSPVPLETWIDISLHDRDADPGAAVRAAVGLIDAAEAAYMTLGFAECDQIATLAHHAAIASTPSAERDTGAAYAISYRLLAADRPGHHRPEADDALAAEAENTAQANGNSKFQTRAALMRARTLQHTEGLDAQIATLDRARTLAAGVDDPTLPQAAAIVYARQAAKRDLAAARALLAEVETAWYDRDLTSEEVLWYNLGQMYCGILSFDAGDFDNARQRLTSALVQAAATCRVQQAVAANFAAQLHFALGGDTEAVVALERSLDIEIEFGVTTAWGAYNRALLAEHLASSGNAGAVDLARRAWQGIQSTGHPNLTVLVRGHLAETLYQCGDAGAALEEACALAAETIEETARTGHTRSAIIAHALIAAARTRSGDAALAYDHARAAVRLLDGAEEQPALRAEVVLHRCAHAYRAAGDPEAAQLLDRARAVVERKAANLADPERRARYLALPLHQELLTD